MAFQGAQRFTIGTFNAIVTPTPSIPDPVSILHSAPAVEATHTSKTASYAPKCHPGTRIKVTGDIVDWAFAGGAVSTDGDQRSTSICWFQGPAGGGKTCIMREVAKRLEDEGMLAGTYFFSNRVAGLNSEGPFVATIVHQLLHSVPDAKPAILKAIAERVNIFSESVETQIERLVLKPLAGICGKGASGRYILVVDGFDECMLAERKHLLRVLHTLITSTPSLLLIIASRPELDIRTTFNSESYRPITHSLRLQDYEESSAIRGYLCDEFCRIRESHPAKASIPASWPEEEVLHVLVSKSSGNYILPSTVIKHVDNPRRKPVALLSEVMGLLRGQGSTASPANPLAPLDELYTMILHPPDGDIALIKLILHCVLVLQGWTYTVISPAFFDGLFCLDDGTANMALCDLHSVIGSTPGGGITFHHATLHDFLSNQARSGDLFHSRVETLLHLTVTYAQRLKDWSRCQSDHCAVYNQSSRDFMPKLYDLASDLEQMKNRGAATNKPLPQTLLEFDCRPVWEYILVHDAKFTEEFPISDAAFAASYFGDLYPESFANLALGRSLQQIIANRRKLEDFYRKHAACWVSQEGRLVLRKRNPAAVASFLRKFEEESGIYNVTPTSSKTGGHPKPDGSEPRAGKLESRRPGVGTLESPRPGGWKTPKPGAGRLESSRPDAVGRGIRRPGGGRPESSKPGAGRSESSMAGSEGSMAGSESSRPPRPESGRSPGSGNSKPRRGRKPAPATPSNRFRF